MSQAEFDFEGLLGTIETALAGYDSELQKLRTERDDLDVQIADIEKKAGRLRGMLMAEERKRPDSDAKRDRGITLVLRKIVEPGYTDLDFREKQSFDEVAKHVRRMKPEAKYESIRSALNRLCKNKTLEKSGKRGSYRWALKADEGSKPKDEPCGRPVETQASEPQQGSLLGRPHHEVIKEVKERILEAATKKVDGIGAKVVAWIMTETGADEIHFEEAVKELEDAGQVEVTKGLADDTQVIRVPVDPDSKEALKRVRVQGKEGFPGMERPPHA